MNGHINVPGKISTVPMEDFIKLKQMVESNSTGGSMLKIVFEDTIFAGQTFTVTNGNETKTGIIPDSLVASVNVVDCNCTYTIKAKTSIGGVGSATVEIGPYYGQYTVTVEVPPLAYGVSWDGTTNTKWTRTDYATDFAEPVPYVNGATDYGSPFDDIMPWKGMVKSERSGGTMVAIPKFWYELKQNGNGMSIRISNKALPGFVVSPAHMDRGDGRGERDVVYVGRYHCGASNYKSVTGQKPKTSITRSAARTAIHNLGSNIWQWDWAIRLTVWLLYLVEFADWDNQKCIGYGHGNSVTSSVSSSIHTVGYTDSMPYHTGTTLSSRTTYGFGTQYRHIEGLWDNVCNWIDGCYYNTGGMYIILNPGNFSDSSGGTCVGVPDAGCPITFTVTTSGGYPMFIPSTGGNGKDSGAGGGNWRYNPYFPEDYPCIRVGSSIITGRDSLVETGYNERSATSETIGSRLMELP